jgi:two-component system, NarL family, invasion response regulator UvrY
MTAPGPGSGPIRVLLVDDHPVVRDGYRHILENAPDIRVAGEAPDGETACRLYGEIRPDVVILDLSMPGIGGPETLRRLKALDAAVRVLVFTMHDSETMIVRTLKAGAIGYLTKGSGMAQMVDAVRTVAQWKPHIDSAHVTDLVRNMLTGTSREPLEALSAREFELFKRFAEGQSVAAIAAALHISPRTVGVHHANIMKKLGLQNTAQLVRLAIRCNLIPP